MSKKPKTEHELAEDIQSHPDRGKVKGELVTKLVTVELNIMVPPNLYNSVIQVRGALGYSKSHVAMEAMRLALEFLKKHENLLASAIVQFPPEGRCNFRGQVPERIYKRAIEEGGGVFDKHQIGCLGLGLFVDYNYEEYELFLERRGKELQCTKEEIITSLYGFSKKVSREERLKQLQEGNLSEAQKLKMSV